MSAIQAFSRQLYQTKLAWKFEFNFSEPDYIEQYWTHLGSALEFNRPINMMSLPRDLVHEKLPNASSTLAAISYQHALKEMTAQNIQQSFCSVCINTSCKIFKIIFNLNKLLIIFK